MRFILVFHSAIKVGQHAHRKEFDDYPKWELPTVLFIMMSNDTGLSVFINACSNSFLEGGMIVEGVI